jgi:hypothetical protein
MHTDPLALAASQGPLASKGVLLFVILLTALLILMIYAVVRAPAWQPTRPAEGAGPRPGDRPAPLPRRRAAASSVFQPLPVRETARPAAASTMAARPGAASNGTASTGPASAAAAVPPVPQPTAAAAGARAVRRMATGPAEPDPPVLERPVVTGRPPWGPAPRPPGVI